MLVALGTAGGCKSEKPRPAFEAGTVDMTIGSKSYRLAIADTPQSQAYGLMNRTSMPEDRGMIFVFPDEQERGFYMKNTLIPLDLIYLNAAGRVVKILPMQPQEKDEKGELRTFYSEAPMRYAIELNLGQAKAAGVKVGDTLDIPAGAR